MSPSFFDITLGILRITGGIVVFIIGYHMLGGSGGRANACRSLPLGRFLKAEHRPNREKTGALRKRPRRPTAKPGDLMAGALAGRCQARIFRRRSTDREVCEKNPKHGTRRSRCWVLVKLDTGVGCSAATPGSDAVPDAEPAKVSAPCNFIGHQWSARWGPIRVETGATGTGNDRNFVGQGRSVVEDWG